MDKSRERIWIEGIDKTEDVLSLVPDKEYFKVVYRNNPDKTYTFGKDKILYVRNELNNSSTQEVLDYFKGVADIISMITEDGKKILSLQYDKIDFVREDTILAKYLSGKQPDKRFVQKQDLIFPFGINESQKLAVTRAFASPISIIQGPPGTGKTQTILNIIANAIIQGKTVAVVSNNNSATENVLEKLSKFEFGFIAAFLGNTDNKKKFKESQSGKYPDMAGWNVDNSEKALIRSKAKQIAANIDAALAELNRIAQLKQQVAALEMEQQYFEDLYREHHETLKSPKSEPQLNSLEALRMWIDCESCFENNFWSKLDFTIRNIKPLYKINGIHFWGNSPHKIILPLQKHYYTEKLQELRDEMQKLEKKLDGFDMLSKMKELSNISIRLFADFLSEKYSGKDKRCIFELDDMWKCSQKFIEEYPLILSTTHSIRSSLSATHIYDYLIIDEASQVDVVTGALALSCAKNVVIVGDMMQLPNIVSKENDIKENIIWSKYSLNKHYRYSAENSFLASVVGIWPNAPCTLLKEHYRCHPKIIGFCNEKFYNNQLLVMTRDEGEDDVLAIYRTKIGSYAHGHVNQRQIDVIIQELLPSIGNASPDSIGIISPYRDQKEALSEQVAQAEIEIDTVHKYQGREKENIIVTTVDNVIGKFVDNPNMLNVAVSRAIRRLRVVISADEQNNGKNIGDLVKYIEYNNFDVIDSKIFSVFDLLYKEYAKERQAFLARNPRVSRYDSENLMYSVIKEILHESERQDLECAVHQKMYMLIKNTDRLTDKERKYAMHPWTHLDFVIYNKMNKIPVLVIETDGVAFHKKNSAQYKRDRLKDEILAQHEIPLMRVSTDSSGEREKIKAKLQAL